MKRAAIMAVLLLLLVVGETALLFVIRADTVQTAQRLCDVRMLAQTDPEAAEHALAEVYQSWGRSHRLLGLYVHENFLSQVDAHLREAQFSLREGELTAFHIKIGQALDALESCYTRHLPTPENVL